MGQSQHIKSKQATIKNLSTDSQQPKDNLDRLNSAIRQILEFAKQDKLDIHNFTQGVKITGLAPKKSKDEKYIHSKAGYIKLLNHLKKIACYKNSIAPYLLYIQLKTGLRFGEVLGLTWDCIKWETSDIYQKSKIEL